MSLTSVSEIQATNPRMQALLERHEELSKEIEKAQKKPSIEDHYVKHLKKRKLIVKEKIVAAERMINRG